MKIASILEHLERYAPLSLALDWDNVGLIVGDKNRSLKQVLISLDATENTLDYAIEHGFDLILSHHPLIFRPIKSVTHPLLLKMIEAKVSLISMHTNFDAAAGGVNHALAAALGLEIQESLGDIEAGELGLLCKYKHQYSLEDIVKKVKDSLKVDSLRLWTAGKSMDTMILRIAICGGAGGSSLALASQKAELYISGDISYHSFLDSDIPIIDAGHFATEYPALKNLKNSLETIGVKCEVLDPALHEWSRYYRMIN